MAFVKFDEDSKLWSGRENPPLYNPNISVAQAVLDSCNTFKSKIAQISNDNEYEMSFDDLRLRIIRAAQNLQKREYEAKQVFGVMAKNSQNVAPIVFAAMSIGCPVNTLDPSFGKTELMHMLNITKPVVMFCDVAAHDLVRSCLDELENEAKIFTFDGTEGDSEAVDDLFTETEEEDDFLPVEVDGENDTVMIVCSSGTTGLSKGVCLSHAALLDAMYRFNMNDCSDVMMCFSSLYWISGLIVLVKGTLCGATRIITTELFSPDLQLSLIEKYKVTLLVNAPHHLLLLLKSDSFNDTDLSSVKNIIVAGSKCPMHLQTGMNELLPNGNCCVGYGMSEAAGFISLDFPGPSGRDCIGQLIGGMQMKIIDDDGNRCDPNVDGEICIKSVFKFLGYYGNEQATEELFDDEGFIKSGDVGHFDDDGYLYIVDRKKDLLKYCNLQISPSAIETYLSESPDVKSACIIGIPDDEFNDLPAAVIVRADGSSITEKEIFDMVAEHFSDHCKLRGGVYFVDALQTTPSGKVLRRKIREKAMEMYTALKEAVFDFTN